LAKGLVWGWEKDFLEVPTRQGGIGLNFNTKEGQVFPRETGFARGSFHSTGLLDWILGVFGLTFLGGFNLKRVWGEEHLFPGF